MYDVLVTRCKNLSTSFFCWLMFFFTDEKFSHNLLWKGKDTGFSYSRTFCDFFGGESLIFPSEGIYEYWSCAICDPFFVFLPIWQISTLD